MRMLHEADWPLIDEVVSSLDAAVRGGRIPNPLVASSSQLLVRGRLRQAALQGFLYANTEFLIYAEPGQVWYSPDTVLFEQLVFPLAPDADWATVPALLRGLQALHGAKHTLFGDMFGVASRTYRTAPGVRPLGKSFYTH